MINTGSPSEGHSFIMQHYADKAVALDGSSRVGSSIESYFGDPGHASGVQLQLPFVRPSVLHTHITSG